MLGALGFMPGGSTVGIGVRTAAGKAAARGAENRWTAALAGGCFKSFSGETSVEMGDGSHKPISEVKVGDEVLATDPETGERGPRRVTHLWIHSDTLTDLEVEGGEVITTTEDHPFWNATDREYQRADQLDRGDQLLAADGRLVRVVGLRPGSQRVTTAYNLTVDGLHTYYVLAGDQAVLVHNTGPCGTASPWDLERTHSIQGAASSRNVNELTESMRTNGWQGDPIAVVENAGKLLVVDGHHRVAAAKRAGIEVPYSVVELPYKGYRDLDDVLESWYSVGPDRLR